MMTFMFLQCFMQELHKLKRSFASSFREKILSSDTIEVNEGLDVPSVELREDHKSYCIAVRDTMGERKQKCQRLNV